MDKTPLALKILAAIGALVVVPGGAFLAIANVGTGGKVAIAAGIVWWLIASAVIGKTLLKRKPDLRTPVRATLAVAAVASIVVAFIATRGNTVDEDIATAAPTAQAPSKAERDAALAAEPKAKAESKAESKARQRKAKRKAKAAKRSATSKPSSERAKKAAAPAKPAPGKPAPAKPAPAKPAPAQNVQLLSGTFGGESGHRGQGKATVVKLAKGGRVLTFSSFDVDPGAGDLRVYLHAGRTTSDDLGDFVEIARLKGNKGDQQYTIPSNVDLGRHNTVVIWCVPFTTRIAQASLSP